MQECHNNNCYLYKNHKIYLERFSIDSTSIQYIFEYFLKFE